MVRGRQSESLVHFVERLIFSQWILIWVLAGFELTTIRFADGSINRHAIRPVGQPQKPFSNTTEEDEKIAKRKSLNRQFIGQVAGGRVGPGRAGSPIVFFYKDQTSERLRGNKCNQAKINATAKMASQKSLNKLMQPSKRWLHKNAGLQLKMASQQKCNPAK